MNQSPHILMKCPKCLKEFDLNASYCESCSAMLEPFESETPISSEAVERGMQETADDIKLGRMRTDIEDKFIYALLYERETLKKKLSEKERAAEELQGLESEMGYHALILAVGEKEHEKDEILGRIAKIETTLEEIRTTVETDVGSLRGRLCTVPAPGLLWFLSSRGRHHRMLSEDLRNQNILLDIIDGKRSARYLKARRLGRIALLTCLIVVLTLIVSWEVFTYRVRSHDVVGRSLNRGAEKTTITKEDIISLLEDIKKANVSKDVELWESRYSKKYLELPGKRESVSEQWKNYDYRTLVYSIDDVTAAQGKSGALITWKMELLSKKTGDVRTLTQRLRADFVLEDGKVKISSVTKQ